MFYIVNIKDVIENFNEIFKTVSKPVIINIINLAIDKAISNRQNYETVSKGIIKQLFVNGHFSGKIQCELYINHKTMRITYANIKFIMQEAEFKE